jgi:citrate lyase synthetase
MARFVGVFHPVARVVHCPEPSVDADVRLSANALRIAKKFVGAEPVALQGVPG